MGDVLPFDAEKGPEICAVPTDNGKAFCGTERHAHEL